MSSLLEIIGCIRAYLLTLYRFLVTTALWNHLPVTIIDASPSNKNDSEIMHDSLIKRHDTDSLFEDFDSIQQEQDNQEIFVIVHDFDQFCDNQIQEVDELSSTTVAFEDKLDVIEYIDGYVSWLISSPRKSANPKLMSPGNNSSEFSEWFSNENNMEPETKSRIRSLSKNELEQYSSPEMEDVPLYDPIATKNSVLFSKRWNMIY